MIDAGILALVGIGSALVLIGLYLNWRAYLIRCKFTQVRKDLDFIAEMILRPSGPVVSRETQVTPASVGHECDCAVACAVCTCGNRHDYDDDFS